MVNTAQRRKQEREAKKRRQAFVRSLMEDPAKAKRLLIKAKILTKKGEFARLCS